MVAPFVLDGPINRDAFQAHVDQVLVPELAPGDIVIMDTLQSHKGPVIRIDTFTTDGPANYFKAAGYEPD